MNPCISVIVPVYRVEAYLDQCVESLVRQTHRNLEILLVDDGSPDRCGAMCDAWAARDSRIRVIHKENGGLSDARNAGIAAATGEYIGFVDSDDFVSPQMYEILLQQLQRTGSDIAVGRIVVTDGDTVPEAAPLEGRYVLTREEAVEHLLAHPMDEVCWNKLYPRAFFETVRFPALRCGEDTVAVYDLISMAHRVCFDLGAVCFYRQRPGSIIHTISINSLDALKAQVLRADRIAVRDPRLLPRARVGIWTCGSRLAQEVLQGMPGPERRRAFRILREELDKYPLTRLDAALLPRSKALWFGMMRVSLVGSCVLRNGVYRLLGSFRKSGR